MRGLWKTLNHALWLCLAIPFGLTAALVLVVAVLVGSAAVGVLWFLQAIIPDLEKEKAS
jgi:hypothetical protein